jgi:hypothetical protein
MKRAILLAIAAVALLGLPAGASAQFEGVLDYTMKGEAEGRPIVADWRMWIAKPGWRTEMTMDTSQLTAGKSKEQASMMPATMKLTMLGKISDKGKAYFVNDAKKVYSVIQADDETRDDDEEKWTAKKMGTSSIAGFSCQEVQMTDEEGDRIDACFTTAIAGSRDWLEAMRTQNRRNEWMNAMRRAGVEGFPIRMMFLEKGEKAPNMVMELQKATKQSVPASMFTIPADYKETGMIGVMTSPEQDQAMSEQMKAMQKELEKLPPEQRKQIEEMMKKYGAQPPPQKPN